MLFGKKVVVVLPAYNAAKTLVKTVQDLPRDVIDDVILVDDDSSDATVKVASGLGLRIFKHRQNGGYPRE
jgi:glycosyltransferase involved in cell wall biosynthesis